MGARHPLPYAYAKAHTLLLEDDGQRLVLWKPTEQYWVRGYNNQSSGILLKKSFTWIVFIIQCMKMAKEAA